MSEGTHKPPLTKDARSLLTAVLLLNLLALALLVYRLRLPTDGWLVTEPDGFEATGFVYQQNVLGLESELQAGDWLTAVNDQPISNDNFTTPADWQAAWRVGNEVVYTIVRDGQTLTVPVILGRWEWEQLLAATISPNLSQLVSFLGALLFVAISFYAFWQRPNAPAARALLLLATFLLNILLTLDILPVSMAELTQPLANWGVSLIVLGTFSLLLPPAFIRFGLVFPRPKPILARHPWLAYLPYGVGLLVVVAFWLRLYVVGWLWTATAVFITLLLLLHNAYTMRDASSRGQLRWALGSTILGLSLFLLTYVNLFFVENSQSPLAQLLSALSGLGFAVMGIGLAVAVLRYHLFDIERLVNRALVYGGLTLAVVLIYILTVGYLSFLLQTEANLAISLLATGVVAVLLGRLQAWLQRSVNRLMYGQRDEPYQVLTQLGQQLQTAVTPHTALQQTVATIAHALKLPYVAIRWQQNGRFQTIAVHGQAQPENSTFPLVSAGTTIGELVVAVRSPAEPLTPADNQLLHHLAQQLSPVAQAVQLTLALEQARLRSVAAREETRRQLGSDLHDGVGHQLTGLLYQVKRANQLLATDPEAAADLFATIGQQLNAAIGDVRRLAHQLHPPELELLGLRGALRERAEASATFVVHLDLPERLPPLAAAVETAVYYITREALTNIEKHARARNCWLRLRMEQGETAVLHLEIRDDGQGMVAASSQNLAQGLGLLSMQTRAAEVGGSCRVERGKEGGTAVVVAIPIGKEINTDMDEHLTVPLR